MALSNGDHRQIVDVVTVTWQFGPLVIQDMPWTRIHHYVRMCYLDNTFLDLTLQLINDSSIDLLETSYWTLSPLHLSVIFDMPSIQEALRLRGVRETDFFIRLFEEFAVYSQRLVTLSELWDKSSEDSKKYVTWRRDCIMRVKKESLPDLSLLKIYGLEVTL